MPRLKFIPEKHSIMLIIRHSPLKWGGWHVLLALALVAIDAHKPACAQPDVGVDPPSTPTPVSSTANTTSNESETATVVNKSLGQSLQLSVVNAIVNYVNNTRLANVQIKWDLLPLSTEISQMANIDSSDPKSDLRLEINNADIPTPARWGKQNADKLGVLKSALGLSSSDDLVALQDPPRRAAFSERYVTALQDAARTQLITSDEFITALRDHYYLLFLLGSNGIHYTLNAPDAELRGNNPRSFNQQIRWEIGLYPIQRGSFTFYRVTLKSRLARTEQLEFAGTTQSQATLKTVVAFNNSISTIGISNEILSATNTIETISPPQKDELPNVGAQLGGSKIEGILRFVGNAELKDIVDHQLFGGTRKSSLFYGGLIGQGSIKQLVGVNQIVKANKSGNSSVGFLFGVAPERNNALFAGPTLQSGPITIGAGVVAREKADSSDTHVKIGAGVTAALDVSQLVGGKKNVQTIVLKENVIGGTSDELARNTFTVFVKVRVDQQADLAALQGKTFIFRRIREFSPDGKPDIDVTNEQQQVTIPIPLTPPIPNSRGRALVLPRGTYVVDVQKPATLPDNYEVRVDLPIDSKPLATQVPFPIGQLGQEGALPFDFVIVKKGAG